MKEWMRGIKYRTKDEVGLDPRKYNFQLTVRSVICDCEELGNRKKKKKQKKPNGFLCNRFCFVTEI